MTGAVVDDEIFAGGIEGGETERGERHETDRSHAMIFIGVG